MQKAAAPQGSAAFFFVWRHPDKDISPCFTRIFLNWPAFHALFDVLNWYKALVQTRPRFYLATA
jgi:hypothetical protein